MPSYIRARAQRAFPAPRLAFPLICTALCAAAFALASACGPTRPAEHATSGGASQPAASSSASSEAGPTGETGGPPAADDIEVPPAP